MSTTVNIKNQYEGFINTPSIFKKDNDFLNPSIFDFPSSKNRDNSLHIKDNLMLGKRAEVFFDHFISNHSDYKIVAKNIQLYSNKITIGELDFILQKTTTNELFHIELAYKFYVYDPDFSTVEIEKWIGPNRKDNFIKKITKLNEHQFPLLYSKEAQSALKSFYITTDNIQQKICFKAQLFVPYNNPPIQLSHINPEAIKGTYLNFKKLKKSSLTSFQYHIPKKQDWFINPEKNVCWEKFEEIEENLNTNMLQKKSCLVWLKDHYNKTQRIFIVWW